MAQFEPFLHYIRIYCGIVWNKAKNNTGPGRMTKPVTSYKLMADEKSKACVIAWTASKRAHMFKEDGYAFLVPSRFTQRACNKKGRLSGGTGDTNGWKAPVHSSSRSSPLSSRSTNGLITFFTPVYCFAVSCWENVTGGVKSQMKGRFWRTDETLNVLEFLWAADCSPSSHYA